MKHKVNWLFIILISCTVLVACSQTKSLPGQQTATPEITPIITPHPPFGVEESEPLKVEFINLKETDLAIMPFDSLIWQFNKKMDIDSAVPVLEIMPLVEGDLEWNSAKDQLKFTPQDPFTPGGRYSVILSADLSSIAGEKLQGNRSFSFQVEEPPRVLQHLPGESQLSNRKPAITLEFNHEMDQESVASSLTIEPAAEYRLVWESSSKVQIIVQKFLSIGTRYRFTLHDAAKDTWGIPIEKDYHWDYWLEGMKISLYGPSFGTPTQPLFLSFNYPVQPLSFEQSIQVEPEIECEYRWSWDRTTVTFVLLRPLAPDITYTFRFLAPMKDSNGNEYLTPGPIAYHSPPPILSTVPAIREEPDDIDHIEILFDRAIDHNQVEATFRLDPPLPGSFSWDGNRLIYRLEGLLAEYTTYTVSLDAPILDQEGQMALHSPFSWSFLTGTIEKAASFGDWGSKVQVVDTKGIRAVQFSLHRSEATRISFELHELNLRQFIQLASIDPSFKQPSIFDVDGETRIAKSWEITSGLPREHWNIKQVYIPEDVPAGLYILAIRVDEKVQDQLALVLTRNTIMVKQAGRQLFVWVTDLHGKRIKDLEIRIYTTDGRQIRETNADENGIYRTVLAPTDDPLMILARDKNGDVTASGMNSTWRTNRSYYYNWSPFSSNESSPPLYKVYTYTDRPIYRPGQTIYFKTVIRQDEDVVYSLPQANTPIEVRIRDARENIVQTMQLSTNDFGALHGDFHIAEDAMLGDYFIEVLAEGKTYRQRVKIQDYRKPDILVTLTTDALNYIHGDQITVAVKAQYFYGQPVKDAKVTLRQYELDRFYGYWWEDRPSSNQDEYIWYESGRAEIQGNLDSSGQFSGVIKAEIGKSQDYEYYYQNNPRISTLGIEVTIDDGSHQTVSGFAVVKVANAAEKIMLDSGGWFHLQGTEFHLDATVMSLSDEPIASHPLALEVRQWDARHRDYGIFQEGQKITTDEGGQASFPLTFTQEGHYKLTVKGVDSRGNRVEASRWIGIFAENRPWAFGNHTDDLSITAEYQTYSPYQNAKFFIESTFEGPALLTFERGKVWREKPIQLTPPITQVELPIIGTDAPNIFVTVSAWMPQVATLGEFIFTNLPDSRLITDTVELTVNAQRKELELTINADQNIYQPGEEATVILTVTDSDGKPVVAEVSLAVVDEAIFSLSEELSPPILDAFYGRRENSVRTYDSMSPLREIWSPGRGGGGGEGSGTFGNPRSDFPDTAIWFADLHTDADGKAVVTFNLPDNLTSWRLTVKAITEDTLVGETYTNILTQKEIVVRPIIPRSLTAGDQVILKAMVHNYSQRPQRVEVSLKIDSGQILGAVVQTVNLEPGEMQPVQWPIVATKAGDMTLTVWAEAGLLGDAVKLTLPVKPLAVLDMMTQVGTIEESFSTSILFPQDALDISTLEIELSRSISGSLLSGLEFLTGYPYGCVEQIMSKALPNAVIGRAFYQLGESFPAMEGDLDSKINAGLQMLYAKQHRDGGWGWWYDDASHDYQTAWVVFGLAMTSEAGYEVDPGAVKRGVQWLSEHLDEMDTRTRAFALYSMALAGGGDLESSLALMDRAYELDTFSQAALALTLHRQGQDLEARQLLKAIETTATITEDQIYWSTPQEDGDYYRKTMASSIRSTASALSAFVRIDPDHEYTPKIVRWLMAQRQITGWGTTNETSFAILGLTDYLLSSGEAKAPVNFLVELNGQRVAEGTLLPGDPKIKVILTADRIARGFNNLRITRGGEGQLYYLLASRIYLPQAEIEAAGSVRITRTYYDAQTQKPVQELEEGQLVRVELSVIMPNDGYYIMVEDHLPGGLESLNESLNSTSHDVDESGNELYSWQDLGYNHKEVYGDRVSFFITELSQGMHTFTYFARATHAGKFVALPTEVSGMYDAALWGRSATRPLTVIGIEYQTAQSGIP